MTAQGAGPLLEIRGMVKKYGEITVLRDVDFSVARGEVHSLVGENGAGKSTLVKIITGVTDRTAGEFVFDGRPAPLDHDRAGAKRLGISVIYQELSLVASLTVAQNIFLGREPTIAGCVLDVREIRRRATELIDRYGFPLHPDSKASALSVGKRQLVEVLKALAEDAKLLIMDEPTSALNAKEANILFGIVERLRGEGVSILYISHRMEEVYRLSDRVTVLRDGRKIGLLERDEIEPRRIINMMIGKTLESGAGSRAMAGKGKDVVISLERLSAKEKFRDVSLKVHKGEIVGLGGLVGSGRTELLRAVFGIDRLQSGRVVFDGNDYRPSVSRSIRAGIGFIPEDRRQQGIIAPLSVRKNIAQPNLDRIAWGGIVSARREAELAGLAIAKVNVRPPLPEIAVGNLSGGNQQKVVVGKWLMRDLKLLLVDEPTVGIDVGAKDEIYNILFGLAKKGVGILLVSSDLPELVKLSDRIIVLRGGSVFLEFDSGQVTEEDVLRASSGMSGRTIARGGGDS